MKAIFVVIMSLVFAAIASTASAQGAGAVVVVQTDAVVKVLKVDHKARTVTARSADGEVFTLHVPKEAQNFDRVKEGLFFKVKGLVLGTSNRPALGGDGGAIGTGTDDSREVT